MSSKEPNAGEHRRDDWRIAECRRNARDEEESEGARRGDDARLQSRLQHAHLTLLTVLHGHVAMKSAHR